MRPRPRCRSGTGRPGRAGPPPASRAGGGRRPCRRTHGPRPHGRRRSRTRSAPGDADRPAPCGGRPRNPPVLVPVIVQRAHTGPRRPPTRPRPRRRGRGTPSRDRRRRPRSPRARARPAPPGRGRPARGEDPGHGVRVPCVPGGEVPGRHIGRVHGSTPLVSRYAVSPCRTSSSPTTTASIGRPPRPRQALRQVGDVSVIAPDSNRSAIGRGITIHNPLHVEEVALADGTTAPRHRRDAGGLRAVRRARAHRAGRPT